MATDQTEDYSPEEFKKAREAVYEMLQLLINWGEEWVKEEGRQDDDMIITARTLSAATMLAADVLASAVNGRSGLETGYRIMMDGILSMAQARLDDEEEEGDTAH